MKRAVVGAALFAFWGGAALVACDLFHSTTFPTLCDISPQDDMCTDAASMPDTASPLPTNFCAWDASVSSPHALRACAWLSACQSPLGNNDLGACMRSALLAYDCATNPDRPVVGALHAYWDILWQATTCADIDRAVFPGAGPDDKVPTCANSGFAACGQAYDGGDNSNVRVECDVTGAAAHGENCLAQGRTCDNGACVGSAKSGCALSGCDGVNLEDCSDAGVDKGINCALYGAKACASTDAGPACVSMNAAVCAATSVVTCLDSGVAQGCPSGTTESVDCNVLSGPGSCNPGLLAPAWDLSSACAANAVPCPPDSCADPDTLTSCARGRTFTVTCSAWQLGPCTTVMTVDGPRAACGRPSR